MQGIPPPAVHPVGNATVRLVTDVGPEHLSGDATAVLPAIGADPGASSVPRNLQPRAHHHRPTTAKTWCFPARNATTVPNPTSRAIQGDEEHSPKDPANDVSLIHAIIL